MRKHFGRAMRKARVGGYHLYDLRLTFATALLVKGAPISYVAAQLDAQNPSRLCSLYARKR